MKDSLRDNNKEITYDGDMMINVLKEIEYILIGLHSMGSYYAEDIEQRRNEYEKETAAFIDNAMITERLAHIRKRLCESFDLELGDDEMDDIEHACEDISYWRKPGDYTTEMWLK